MIKNITILNKSVLTIMLTLCVGMPAWAQLDATNDVTNGAASIDFEAQEEAVQDRLDEQQEAVLERQTAIEANRAAREQQIFDAQDAQNDAFRDRAFGRDASNIGVGVLNDILNDSLRRQDRLRTLQLREQEIDRQFQLNQQRDQNADQFERQREQQIDQLRDDKQETQAVIRDAFMERRLEKQAERLRVRQAVVDERVANQGGLPAYQVIQAESLGDLIRNFGGAQVRFPSLFYIFSYVSGAFLMAMGLVKANKATMNPQQNPASNAIKYMVAGVFMSSLPTTVAVLRNSMGFQSSMMDLDYSEGLGRAGEATAGGEAAERGLDQFFVMLIEDIGQPMLSVISLFGFVAGVFLIANALQRLTKGAQEGPKGPGGVGTIMNFVVGSALISLVPSINIFLNSLFGGSDVVTYLNLSTIGDQIGASSMAQAEAVITSLLAFLAIIGAISFVRGLFMLKDVSDGAQNASFMGSISHLIAGVLCVNFGGFLEIFQNTLNLGQYGIVFQ